MEEVIRWVVAIVALVAPAVVLGALLFAARRRRRLGAVFLAIIALLAAGWALAFAAQATDFRDADGWVDCWPGCTVLQQAVGTTLFYAPIYAVVLAMLAIALAVRDRRRRKGSLLP